MAVTKNGVTTKSGASALTVRACDRLNARAAAEVGFFASAKETEKNSKYHDHAAGGIPPGVHFVPFVLECLGHIGGAALDLLERWATAYVTLGKGPKSVFYQIALPALSTALWEGNANKCRSWRRVLRETRRDALTRQQATWARRGTLQDHAALIRLADPEVGFRMLPRAIPM